MLGLLKFKRERNYNVVKVAMEAECIDTEAKAQEAIKLTFDNGKNGTIVAGLIFAILLILFPQARSMVLALGLIVLVWIWASVFNGKKQILRYIEEEIKGNKPIPKETEATKRTEAVKDRAKALFKDTDK